MYRYNYDHATKDWNVFQDIDGWQYFICKFNTAAEAKAYCIEKNNRAQVPA